MMVGRGLMAIAGLGVLAGCAVGPDFRRPAAPESSKYIADSMALQTESAPTVLGQAQRLVVGLPIQAQWWRSLGSPALDALIEDAFAQSPTLASAQAALRQAQALYAARAGATQYPQLDMGVGAQRQRLDPIVQGQSGPAREFDFYNASLGVRYQVDIAGGNRRALEAMMARADYGRFELEAARLALAANLAAAAITRAQLAAQVEAMDATLEMQEEQLRLAHQRVQIGQAVPDELLALEVEVEQVRAERTDLSKLRVQAEHLLSVLAGRSPGEGGIPAFTLADFTLPAELPLIVPSELVRRRPDIQAAEALMQVASAEYGVAVAKLYPQLDISASFGAQALSSSALFGGGSAVWNMIAQFVQPLFNPSLSAEKRAALAALDAATANYQSVVLDALRNVADVLVALEHDARILVALAAADDAAQRSAESVQRQVALGAASYIQALVAQQQLHRSRVGLAAAQAQRLSNSVALYQAMGGVPKTKNPIIQ